MLKIGLEKEMFLLDENKKPIVIPEGLPFDECGLLLEARGKPSNDIYEAIYSLIADEIRIRDRIKKDYPNYKVVDTPVLIVDRKTKVAANRQYAKGVLSYRNLYGYEHHKNKLNEVTAGVHVSFTDEMAFIYQQKVNEYKEFKYNRNFDWARIFIKLDNGFKQEISDSKRNPGFYELKPDSRIEYRSLPSNVDLNKLLQILKDIL